MCYFFCAKGFEYNFYRIQYEFWGQSISDCYKQTGIIRERNRKTISEASTEEWVSYCCVSLDPPLKLFTVNFVTNSYGESWDSSCEKSWVPVHDQCVPVKKKQGVRNWKYLGFYSVCNETVNMETGAKTLYHSLLKLKYSRSIYLKHKKDLILNLHF